MSLAVILWGFFFVLVGIIVYGAVQYGKQSKKLDEMAEREKLRAEYDKIDAAPDVDDPFARMRDGKQ